jgi:TfoX/Sxy family transcriptional regulator of competence genes
MAWEKSSPELIDTFYAALPEDDRVERRKMFGYPCAFANGQMFTGLHQHDLIVRLGEEKRAELLATEGASVFAPMEGRVMKEYVAVPPAIREDPETLKHWIAQGLDYALTLPPKVPKKRKSKK